MFLRQSNGCDSTVTTNLTVASALSSSQTMSICAGESVTVGASTFSTTGTHQVVLTSVLDGCDSTVTINLTVAAPIDVAVTVNQGVMQVANRERLTNGSIVITTTFRFHWRPINNTHQP